LNLQDKLEVSDQGNSPNKLKYSKKSKKIRVRKPKYIEEKILQILKQTERPVTLYKLYKDFNRREDGFSLTSGGIQSALKRLVEKEKVYVKKKIKRYENQIWYKDFDLKIEPIELEDQNEMIIPVYLNRTIGSILEEIPDLSSDFKDLTELFTQAISFYFKNSISDDLKEMAVSQATEKGKISKSIAEQIMR